MLNFSTVFDSFLSLTGGDHHESGSRSGSRGQYPPSREMMSQPKTGGRFTEARRAELRRIGEETLEAIHRGRYKLAGENIDISFKMRECCEATKFYPPDSSVGQWAMSEKPTPLIDVEKPAPTHISILQISTIEAARLFHDMYHNNAYEMPPPTTGVLNFASATKPGGGFKNGAEAQEESIARASTLYPSLTTDEGAKFYKLHKAESAQNNAAYYSHAMIYSPKITVFRDDDGIWAPPFEVDVLTCAAVNAGEILKSTNGTNNSGVMVGIEKEMMERMGRILFLFERKGIKNLVLGTFGTGVFRNDVATVTRIWAQLLVLPSARFRDSFDRIIFAVTGDTTYTDFKNGFEAWEQPRAAGTSQSSKTGVLRRSIRA